jgi:UDP-N-acetyl-D-mannosaminuronate dehydrogenase
VKTSKTLVVGLGEVGGALAAVLSRTQKVLRHDIQPMEFNDPIGVMHVCFPFTQRSEFEDIALSYIGKFKPTLIVINSTIIPGTTRAIEKGSGLPVAYSPVRGKHIRMTEDLLRYKKFVAASSKATAIAAADHFAQAGMKTAQMENPDTLELAKLSETTYFGLLIAFAQELNRYAEAVDGDYSEAIRFFEEIDFLPRTAYSPGFIGGHCVIPNIALLKQVAPSPLLDAILSSNHLREQELALDGPPKAATRLRLRDRSRATNSKPAVR